MPSSRGRFDASRASRRGVSAALVGAACLLAGCGVAGQAVSSQVGGEAPILAAATPPAISVSPPDGATQVPLDAVVSVRVDRGRLDAVTVTTPGAPTPLPGTLDPSGLRWTASAPLAPATTYVVDALAQDAAGDTSRVRSSFTTVAVVERLTTSVQPGDGEVVGVAMPIVLRFNHPIAADRQQNLLRHISVRSDPPQVGAWHWFSPSEVHWRPKEFWRPRTKVTVTADLRGVDAGNGVWGLGSWSETFTIGDKHVSVIDATTHQMQVFDNDQLIHTYPVSAGREPRFPTISGTLFVWYKAQKVHMDSLTLGIPHNSPLGYDEDVFWDVAISLDGFYIHSAPWSVWAQGNTNVSHGCVNLSPERAIEFFQFSQVGDAVIVKGTSRTADASDGEADWQIPFDSYDNTGLGVSASPAPSTPGGI